MRPAACWMFGPPFFFDFFTAMRFADPPFVFQDAESKIIGKFLFQGSRVSIKTTPLLNSTMRLAASMAESIPFVMNSSRRRPSSV
jgi:hypothetical protein